MFIGSNGVKLWYEQCGRGRPILLLHGNGEDNSIFFSLMSALEGEFSLFAPDSRCHGKSSQTRDISYREMMLDMAGFISYAGLEKPICIGFSDGGIVGLMLAMEYPGLLGGLIACGANTRPSGLSASFRVRAEAEYLITRSKLLRLMLTEPNIQCADLMKIKTPTLVVAGSRDLVRENDTRRIAKCIPGAELHILEGETHDSYVSGSARLAPMVRSLADRIAVPA